MSYRYLKWAPQPTRSCRTGLGRGQHPTKPDKLVINSCMKDKMYRCSCCWFGRGIQNRAERKGSNGLIARCTSADVAELVTWHVRDGGDGQQSVCLNTGADHWRRGLSECEVWESSMGALGAGQAQAYGPYPMPNNPFDLLFWFGQRHTRLILRSPSSWYASAQLNVFLP